MPPIQIPTNMNVKSIIDKPVKGTVKPMPKPNVTPVVPTEASIYDKYNVFPETY